MAALAPSCSPRRKAGALLRAAPIQAWLLAGALDLLAAILDNVLKGNTAPGVLKAIASGWFGREAFRGGAGYAVLGLLFHFAIMAAIVAVYWQASRRVHVVRAHPIPAGLAYGLGVYGFMTLVVLPMSNIAWTPVYDTRTLLTGITVHMVMVGLPIAWLARDTGPRGAYAST